MDEIGGDQSVTVTQVLNSILEQLVRILVYPDLTLK